MRRQDAATSATWPMRLLVMSTASRLRSSFCEAHLLVQLVQDGDFLRSRSGGILKERAQLGAAFPRSQNIGKLAIENRGVELAIGHHIGKSLGVAVDKGRHLVLPSLARGVGRNPGDEFGNQGAIGLRCERHLF